MSAVRIWIDRYHLTNLELRRAIWANSLDDSADFMARNDVWLSHSVATKECIEVTATETNIFEFEQHLARSCLRFWKVYDLNLL